MSDKQWDILGIGCATVDDTLYVESFPAGDSKTRVKARLRRCGGLTATALLAAARLGGTCAYAGMLGDGEHSRFIETQLVKGGIDMEHVVRHADAQPVYSTVIVGESDQTRTIFFYTGGRVGADDHLPTADVIQAARVLFMDTYGMTGNLRAARIAREAGVPVVCDFENSNAPLFHDVLALVNHVILKDSFALSLTGTTTLIDAAQALWQAGRVVVLTSGSDGCLYLDDAREPVHHPAYPVHVVDTTGCGDVFHGAYAMALAQGMPLDRRIAFASAAAALKATQVGIEGVPPQQAIHTFLQQRPANPLQSSD